MVKNNVDIKNVLELKKVEANVKTDNFIKPMQNDEEEN